MKIHSFLILNSEGTCLYNRNFTEELKVDINLITPFFSALFSFSEKTLSRKIEELEISGLRFMFKTESNFIFVLLTDSTVSLLFSNTRLDRLSNVFFKTFDEMEDNQKEYTEIINPEFDRLVDIIITGEEEFFKSERLYEKVVEIFKGMIYENEIIGVALLNTKGIIVYSSLPNDILLGSIKELEIRFMTGALSLPEMFYGLENGQKVFSTIINHKKSGTGFFVVLLFESSVPLGMANVKLHSIGKRIQKLLKIYT